MERLKQNKTVVIFSSVLMLIIIVFLWITIPILIHDIKVRKISNQIEQVQLQIELNKEQRNSCYNNMELWHNENEDNRKILNELMKEYNELVGFTKASTTD